MTLPLGDVVKLKYGKSLPLARRSGSGYPVYGSNGIVGFYESFISSGETVIIGRKGSYGEIVYSNRSCWPIDTAYFIDRTSTHLDLTWLKYILPSLKLNTLNRATAIPGLNRDDAYALKIPVVSGPEQRRVAAILDKIDELRVKRRQAIAKLDSLAQSIFHEMFGDPVYADSEWGSIPLSEVAELRSGGTPSKDKLEYWQGPLKWFSPKDLKSSKLFDSIDHISEKVIIETSLKKLPRRTVVFVVRGMILAYSFPVAILECSATINQDLKAVLFKKKMRPDFILGCLQAQKNFALSLVETSAHGTKRLASAGISRLQVVDAPLAEQDKFVGRVSQIETLRSYHRAHLAHLDALFASLQSRAFKGEL